MIDKNSFGKRLQEARKEKGYTGEQIAEKLNISYSFLRQMECGTRLPRLELLAEIAEELECSTDFLIRDNFGASYAKIIELSSDLQFLTSEKLDEISALVIKMKEHCK